MCSWIFHSRELPQRESLQMAPSSESLSVVVLMLVLSPPIRKTSPDGRPQQIWYIYIYFIYIYIYIHIQIWCIYIYFTLTSLRMMSAWHAIEIEYKCTRPSVSGGVCDLWCEVRSFMIYWCSSHYCLKQIFLQKSYYFNCTVYCVPIVL